MQCKQSVLSTEQIIDISLTSPSNYYIVFARIPNFIYFIDSFKLPSVTNKNIEIEMPMAQSSFKAPGHKQDYEDLSINFRVNEDYRNYFYILKWMRENERYVKFSDTFSDASLVILNNAKKPLIECRFHDLFPMSLSGIDYKNQSSEIITADVSFSSHDYNVHYLDGSNETITYQWEDGFNNPILPKLFSKL